MWQCLRGFIYGWRWHKVYLPDVKQSFVRCNRWLPEVQAKWHSIILYTSCSLRLLHPVQYAWRTCNNALWWLHHVEILLPEWHNDGEWEQKLHCRCDECGGNIRNRAISLFYFAFVFTVYLLTINVATEKFQSHPIHFDAFNGSRKFEKYELEHIRCTLRRVGTSCNHKIEFNWCRK